MNRNADPDEYMKALHGLDWPASKDGIVRKASDTGGIDTEVIHVLGLVPSQTYDTPEELAAAVEAVYLQDGGLADGGPAAPSEFSTPEKDLIKTMADPRKDDSH